MGKPRNDGQKGGKPLPAKAIKEGQVKKNKAPPAFKQTPKGKVALINGKKNGDVNTQKKPFEKPAQQPKATANAANKKKGNSNAQVNSPTKQSPQKKKKNNKKAAKPAAKEESDSDEDINEGISIDEQLSIVGEDDDDSSDEDSTPNILGASLAEDSDEDDEDFEADSEEETEKKGVKMFKGIQSTNDDDDEDDDEDEDDDDDEEDDEDDDEDENDVSANVTASSMNTSGDSSLAMESTEDEDDDEDDDDDDDDDDDESPGLKALLGQSLVDDEDDEDFNDDDEDDDDDDEIDDSEEDEDEGESQSDKNMSNVSGTSDEGKVRLSPEAKAEQDKRTIYIGNVPKDMKESRLRKEFGKYGEIESLRVRGVVPDSPGVSYKVAAIKRKIHEKVACICVFIIFKSEKSAKAALVMNGKQLDGNYLRVDIANNSQDYDPKRTIFLGNLAFGLQDNELWELFGKCGKIEYVRTVRDRKTGVTRGIGYVCFKSPDSVALALDLNGTELQKRQIRVERYTKPAEKKPRQEIGGKKRRMQGNGKNPSPKKAKNDEGTATSNAERRVNQKQKRSQGEKQRTPNANGNNANKGSFQGQKADAKKGGKKFNKFEKKKKAIAGKLMAKPKKPVA